MAMEPQGAGHPAMTTPRDAGIAVLKFWRKQDFDPAHPETPITTDMVEYAPKGRAGMSTQEKVERLRKTNPIVWPQIERHYEHWTKGQEMPTDGVPLEAWPGFPEGMIRRCKDVNVRTIEDFATLTDSGLDRIGMGARMWQQQALAFLGNADRAAAAKKQTDLETQNAALLEQLAEMRAEIAAMKRPKRGKAAATDGDEDV